MPDMPEQSNIAEIAHLLDMRRRSNHPTVLFLGSRAGGLFRSQALLEAAQRFPGQLFDSNVQQDQFAASYQFLQGLRSGTQELHNLLASFLREVAVTEADRGLAELIRLKLFSSIITTNIDGLLEQALENARMRKLFDFEVVGPERIQSFEAGTSERRLYCRIVKPFGDLAAGAGSYQIVKSRAYLDDHPLLKSWLEKALAEDLLMVGLDIHWDNEIIRAFAPRRNSLWFVNEERLIDNQQIKPIFQGQQQMKYIAGQEGSYEVFFTELCRHLGIGLPEFTAHSIPGENFVNRATELRLVSEALATLSDQDFLQRTPVLVFHGIGGIGKTAMLQRVMQRCDAENLPYIHADAQDIPGFSRAIMEQVSRYHNVQTLLENDGDWLDRSVIATTELLRRGPAVMLVDSLDSNNTELVRWLEDLLGRVLLGHKFFVILTSKRKLSFERDRSVARRLRLWELRPLDRESCQDYLSRSHLQLEDEVREIVYEWTDGYPLAMQVMGNAIAAGLDPRREEDRLLILAELVEQVIVQKVLGRVSPAKFGWYQTILPLLSVPRRLGVDMIGSLINEFAPEFQREAGIAHLTLPREISEATEMLSWNQPRAGYAVNTSVRNIFLLDLKIRQPVRYRAIHAFLAHLNYERMMKMTGLDRVRCLREYLYHLACKGDEAALLEQVREAVQQTIEEAPETLIQFSEEFLPDGELQEAFGIHKSAVLALIHRLQAQIYRQFAQKAAGADRIRFLQDSFTHLMQDQEIRNMSQTVKEEFEQLMQEEAPDIVWNVYDGLSRKEDFRSLLGPDFQRLATQIRQNLPPQDPLAEG